MQSRMYLILEGSAKGNRGRSDAAIRGYAWIVEVARLGGDCMGMILLFVYWRGSKTEYFRVLNSILH